MQVVEVVAAVITRQNGEILACRRAAGRPSAGLWEFPGGKVERGEDPREALVREIREELGAKIAIGELVVRNTTEVNGVRIDLACYRSALDGDGPAESTDHDRMRWLSPADLHQLEWALPDLPAVRVVAAAQSRP